VSHCSTPDSNRLIDFGGGVQFHIRTNDKNNIGAFRIQFPMQPKGLSYYPFDSISLHGPSDLPVHTDPKSAESEVVGAENQDKTSSMPASALFVHLFKLPPFP